VAPALIGCLLLKRQAGGELLGGVGINSAGATAAQAGGSQGGFPTPNLWQVLTDTSDNYAHGELVAFIISLDKSPAFRRGQVAMLLGQLQGKLSELPDDTAGDLTVPVAAGDLVLMAHLLLRHQA